MSVKAVIFDLDGVIVSTDEYHYLAWKRSPTASIFILTGRSTSACAA